MTVCAAVDTDAAISASCAPIDVNDEDGNDDTAKDDDVEDAVAPGEVKASADTADDIVFNPPEGVGAPPAPAREEWW